MKFMNIALVTLGSRGDLQPFVALAVGLQHAGHRVRLISAKADEAFARSFGLDYYPLDVDVQQLMDGPEVQAMSRSGNPLQFIRSHVRGTAALKQAMLAAQEAIWQGCQDADALVYHPGMANAYFMAQELGIPGIMASPFPVSATGEYPAVLFYNGPRLGPLYNWLTHFVFEHAFWQISRPVVREFWRRRGHAGRATLAPPSRLQAASGVPVLYGYSERLFPRPHHWPANLAVTGSWQLPAAPGWQPPPALSQFIEAGAPPVYVGFGSMKDQAAFGHTLGVVTAAVAQTGQRAVVALGWNRPPAGAALPENVLLIDGAPHAWLFPRMAAVVHHGGAGTTAAGLHAGKPTVVVPHMADQPAWGRRVFELGVGPRPIPKKALRATTLAAALAAATGPQMTARAAALGEQLRREDGVATAVNFLNQYFETLPI